MFCRLLMQNLDEKQTPISDARPRAGSLGLNEADKTETLKELHMPRKISF
jgi:hypothetical protein